MQVYYAASVRANLDPLSPERKKHHISHLSTYGLVLTENLGANTEEEVDMGFKTDKEIFKKDMDLLQKADYLVADISTPSLGVGFVIALASTMKIPTLCVTHVAGAPVSAMINGCPNVTVMVYSEEKKRRLQSFEECVWRFMLKFFPRPHIILSGPPGSGKSTLGKSLAEKLNVVHISTGDMLRWMVSKEFPVASHAESVASEVKRCMNSGQLVPSSIMEEIVLQRLGQVDCRRKGFVLDGYPPSMGDLDNLLRGGVKVDFVLVMVCPDELAVQRQVTRGERDTDQQVELARNRVNLYRATVPNFMKEGSTWFPKAPVILLDATAKPTDILVAAVKSITCSCGPSFTGSTGNSFYPLYLLPGQTARSSRFHFHVDAVDGVSLLQVLRRIHTQLHYTQGQIKVYPIKELLLGPQTRKEKCYANMMNFHKIQDANDEFFATGHMGEAMDLDMLTCVLREASLQAKEQSLMGSLVEKNDATFRVNRYMVEAEEYLTEWKLCKDDNNVRVGMAFDNERTSFKELSHVPYGDEGRIELVEEGEVNPYLELHHGFDVPKAIESNSKIPLEALMTACTELGTNRFVSLVHT